MINNVKKFENAVIHGYKKDHAALKKAASLSVGKKVINFLLQNPFCEDQPDLAHIKIFFQSLFH